MHKLRIEMNNRKTGKHECEIIIIFILFYFIFKGRDEIYAKLILGNETTTYW